MIKVYVDGLYEPTNLGGARAKPIVQKNHVYYTVIDKK
jgi:hypothetical protein